MLLLDRITGPSKGIAICGLLVCCLAGRAEFPALAAAAGAGTRVFPVSGVVKAIEPDGRSLVIAHQAVAGYMEAMTMPFKLKETNAAAGLQVGDEISFQLHVTETESWIDQIIARTPRAEVGGQRSPVGGPVARANSTPAGARTVRPRHPLMDYAFTNELGQAVSLGSFRGQALAITFFFTRCPIPDYCPRLSRNFEAASRQLAAMPNAPTNWHFLSVSFDPAFDTPPRLRAYAEGYQYDQRHWSFLTGPADKIREFARQSDVQFEGDGAFFNHNFRTLIIDAAGRLQMVFPTSGDLSQDIISEILKAAVVTNRSS